VEGAEKNRGSIRRPEPRKILTRAELAHTPQPQPVIKAVKASPKPVHPYAPTPAVASVAHAKKAHKVTEASTKENLSKLTPVYAKGAETPADKVRAIKSGLEWKRTAAPVAPKKQHAVVNLAGHAVDQAAPGVRRSNDEVRHAAPIAPITPDVHEEEPTQLQNDFDDLLAADLLSDADFNPFDDIDGAESEEISFDAELEQIVSEPVESTYSPFATSPQPRLHNKVAHATKKAVSKLARRKKDAKKNPRTLAVIILLGAIVSGSYATIGSLSGSVDGQQVHAAGTEAVAGASVTSEAGEKATLAASTDANPVTITIPKLGLTNAKITEVGLTGNGSIDTPDAIWEAGWWAGSVKPGQKGQVFIDGHASSTNDAIFGHLEDVTEGDSIQLTTVNGQVVSYRVVQTVNVDRSEVDMTAALSTWGDAKRGLTLFSCDGEWDESAQTLTNRVVVWAVQESQS